jgi:hypothetical protein
MTHRRYGGKSVAQNFNRSIKVLVTANCKGISVERSATIQTRAARDHRAVACGR